MKTITEEIILGDCLKFPKEKVFYFHTDITNLKKISPNSKLFSLFISLEIIRVDYPFEVDSEFEILIRILYFFKVPWKLKIIENRPEDYFKDQESSGIFKKFIHTHKFLEKDKKTIIKDQIEFESKIKALDLFLTMVWKLFLKIKLKQTKNFLKKSFV